LLTACRVMSKTTTEGSERCERDQLAHARIHPLQLHLALI
jgi:hypothetical protein